MPDVTLHQFEISPFCQKVRRILRLKEIPFEIREVSALRSTIDVRRINRIGRLPVLEIDGELIADSSEIARVLDERFPTRRSGPRTRVSARSATCSRTGRTRASTSTR